MEIKRIYKYSLECSLFKLINSPNKIVRINIDDKPNILWEENDTTIVMWTYDNAEHRDNDFKVVNSYYICNDLN